MLPFSVLFLTTVLNACATAAQEHDLGQCKLHIQQREYFPLYLSRSQDAEFTQTEGDLPLDDALFQDLLAVEWAILQFYTRAVEMFNETSFQGFPDTTYARIQQIRDEEAARVQLVRGHIGNTSVKPGPCSYRLDFLSPVDFLLQQVKMEAFGAAFLPGLVAQARYRSTRSTLCALLASKIRYVTWAMMDNFHADPFIGPADTVLPYPTLLLGLTGSIWTIPGSCPKNNPPFPKRKTAFMHYDPRTTKGQPGSDIQFTFPIPSMRHDFKDGRTYYAVYYHALSTVSALLDTDTLKSKIPDEFGKDKGLIVVVIANQPGAPSEDTVVAGPLVLLQQHDFTALQNELVAGVDFIDHNSRVNLS